MTPPSQFMSSRQSGGYSEPTGYWSATRNLHWAHTSSRPAAAICITGSTSEVARSFITRASRTVSVGERWRKFLSLVSPAASPFGFEPARGSISLCPRSSSVRGPALGKTAIGY